jgi:hypothetical protein
VFQCVRGGQRKIYYNLIADKLELLKDNNENYNDGTDNASLRLATTCPNYVDVTSPQQGNY